MSLRFPKPARHISGLNTPPQLSRNTPCAHVLTNIRTRRSHSSSNKDPPLQPPSPPSAWPANPLPPAAVPTPHRPGCRHTSRRRGPLTAAAPASEIAPPPAPTHRSPPPPMASGAHRGPIYLPIKPPPAPPPEKVARAPHSRDQTSLRTKALSPASPSPVVGEEVEPRGRIFRRTSGPPQAPPLLLPGKGRRRDRPGRTYRRTNRRVRLLAPLVVGGAAGGRRRHGRTCRPTNRRQVMLVPAPLLATVKGQLPSPLPGGGCGLKAKPPCLVRL